MLYSGFNDELLSEKERQAELLRLKLARRRANQEENFHDAAMIMGLAERQQAAANERLVSNLKHFITDLDKAFLF